MSSVLQPWVEKLSFMQQSVLITSCRGPDGLSKNHVSKVILRWLRRCFLYTAFGRKIFVDPYELGGGSFTGPCPAKYDSVEDVFSEYLQSVDEVPHHFHLHLMHAAEIIGYKHPMAMVRNQWYNFYKACVDDAHLNVETEEEMDYRLGDNEKQWKDKEKHPAK